MPKSDRLEVKRNREWVPIGVKDAIATNERRGRCVECGRSVRVHGRGKNGAAAHVEHITRNLRCSLSDHRI
jgi:hypothetical protein